VTRSVSRPPNRLFAPVRTTLPDLPFFSFLSPPPNNQPCRSRLFEIGPGCSPRILRDWSVFFFPSGPTAEGAESFPAFFFCRGIPPKSRCSILLPEVSTTEGEHPAVKKPRRTVRSAPAPLAGSNLSALVSQEGLLVLGDDLFLV